MYTRLLMCPIQMPSLMYLIFSKKQTIHFFDPLGGRVGRKMFTLFTFSCKSLLWPPFFPGLNGRTGNSLIFLRIAWRILCRRYMSHFRFSPTNKINFICRKEERKRDPIEKDRLDRERWKRKIQRWQWTPSIFFSFQSELAWKSAEETFCEIIS